MAFIHGEVIRPERNFALMKGNFHSCIGIISKNSSKKVEFDLEDKIAIARVW